MYLSVAISNCAPEGYYAPLHSPDTKKDILTAKEIGFEAVEIHIADPTSLDWEDIAQFCQGEKMRVSSIATGFSAKYHGAIFTSFDDYTASFGMKVLKRYIDAGAVTGAGIIVGGMKGSELTNGYTMDMYYDRLYDKIMPGVEYCEQKGVTLLLEAINRYETPFLNTAAETLAFVNRLGSEKVMVHLDTFHMNIEEADMAQAIRSCGNKLGHIHFADNIRNYCGSGAIDFQKVIDALQSIGYEGACAFEYRSVPNEYEAAKRGYDYIKPMMP